MQVVQPRLVRTHKSLTAAPEVSTDTNHVRLNHGDESRSLQFCFGFANMPRPKAEVMLSKRSSLSQRDRRQTKLSQTTWNFPKSACKPFFFFLTHNQTPAKTTGTCGHLFQKQDVGEFDA